MRGLERHGLLCAALLLTAPARASIEANGHSVLEVRVSGRLASGRTVEVPPGGRLRSGDHMALWVKSSRPMYVYVLQRSPDGHTSLLYPTDGHARLRHSEIRIPSKGKSFQLDAQTGTETIYVVGSRRRLDEADPALASALQKLGAPAPATDEAEHFDEDASEDGDEAPERPQGRPPKPSKTRPSSTAKRPAPPLPTGLSMATRGLVLVDDEPSVKIQADDSGIVVYPFTFEHLP